MQDYNGYLVGLSFIVSVVSAFAALDLAERRKLSNSLTFPWALFAAFVVGIGIWSMHFIGMLAYHPGFPVTYNVWLVALSAALPVLAALLGLQLLQAKRMTYFMLNAAGLTIGGLIVAMHVTGMLAMQMPAILSHEPVALTISVGLGFLAAYGPLLAYRRMRASHRGEIKTAVKWLAALLFGLTVTAMHFTALAASRFTVHSDGSHLIHSASIEPAALAYAIGVSDLLLVAFVLIGLFVDRQKATREAAFNERRYSMLFEHSPDAIICYDPDANRVDHANASFYKLVGYSQRELEADGFCKLLEVSGISRLQAALEAVKQGETQRLEQEIRNGNGNEMVLHATMFPVIAGNKTLIYCICKDNTAQKQLERNLIRSKEEAENAARMKSQFLAIVSHEIRTPLNGIMGVNQLLMEMELNDEQGELLRLQEKSGHALMDIINDILDFSRLESGKTEISANRFHLNGLIAETFELFRFKAEAKQLDLRVELDDTVPEFIVADRGKLKQILTNLIGNAVKFTDRGFVRLSANTEFDADGRHMLVFEVADSGIGFEHSQYSRLFQPFSQLHTSLDRHYEGTGLGLAICKQLVELMGGVIGAGSREGGGAVFRFTLPRTAAESGPNTLEDVHADAI